MINIDTLPKSELKKINMLCPGERHDLHPLGINKRYAYCTLVMLGDLYIPGAIVLAYSLRLMGTKADIIVMVTADVTSKGQELLTKFFDHVILVEYVHIYNCEMQKTRMYLNYVFTKFNLFKFVQYEKILFLDANSICLKYFDNLFKLETPAGVYFPCYGTNCNYAIADDLKMPCKELSHGSKIPQKFIRDAIERNNSGISGGILLLTPDVSQYDRIMHALTTDQKIRNLISNKFMWPEQFLSMWFQRSWTSINPIFLGLGGYPSWKILYGVQYAEEKPWSAINSKVPMNEKITYSTKGQSVNENIISAIRCKCIPQRVREDVSRA
jgi:hypothetical protein